MNPWSIRRDDHGFAVAIQHGDWTVLHLVAGSERNEDNADRIVRELNSCSAKLDHYEGFRDPVPTNQPDPP